MLSAGRAWRPVTRSPARANERVELGSGAFPAGSGVDEHLEVERLGRMPAAVAGQLLLEDEHPPMGWQGAAHVAEDAHAGLVVPVVHDRLQQVAVSAGGHRGEEVAGDHLDAVGDPGRGQHWAGAGDDRRQVEEGAVHRGVRGHDPGEEGAGATADVADGSARREVAAGGHRVDLHARGLGHRGGEQRTGGRVVLGQLLPEGAAERGARRRVAGANRVQQLSPHGEVPRRPPEPGPGGERSRVRGRQPRRDPVVGESAVASSSEHAAGDEVAQEPLEGVGVGVDGCRQGVGVGGTARQRRGDPELGSDGERRGVEHAQGPLDQDQLGRADRVVQARARVPGGEDGAQDPGRRQAPCHATTGAPRPSPCPAHRRRTSSRGRTGHRGPRARSARSP